MAPLNYISTKTLHLFFLVFLLFKPKIAYSQPHFFFTICGENGNYTQDSTYQKNLYQVLKDLATHAGDTSFYNSTNGEIPDKVYGMFYCRADINSALCRTCVQEAEKLAVNVNCTTQKEAVIWYEECTLRYANTPITSLDEDEPPTSQSYSPLNASNINEFEQVLSTTMNSLIEQASNNISTHGYATSEDKLPSFTKIYSLVQCTPDILGRPCQRCLLGLWSYTVTLFRGSTEVIFFRPNCQMRYGLEPFYGPLPPPPSPLPSPSSTAGKDAVFYITRIVVPAVGFILVVLCIIGGYVCLQKKKQGRTTATGEVPNVVPVDEGEEPKIKHSNSTGSLQYDLDTIKTATLNFSIDNKLGQGGFGPVYKGRLPDGQDVAVKRLSEDSRQGLRQFTTEVQLLAKLQHRNLVKLLGFCLEGDEKLLVYEFVSNLSLDRFLFDPNKRKYFDWETRFKIIIGIARGLLYLHEDSRVKIIHRDLKSSNILLAAEMNPKIADFGTARLVKIDNTQSNTSKIFGTFGYMAPEFAAAGAFSIKSDVYSFGVILLEIISGQSNNMLTLSLGKDSLISHAWKLWNSGTVMELVDPSLGNNYSKAEILRCVQVGLFCVQQDPSNRPTMESVLLILQNNSSDVQLPPHYSSVSSSDTNVQAHNIAREHDQFQSDQTYDRESTMQFNDLYPR